MIKFDTLNTATLIELEATEKVIVTEFVSAKVQLVIVIDEVVYDFNFI